jgi:hypothetical protein
MRYQFKNNETLGLSIQKAICEAFAVDNSIQDDRINSVAVSDFQNSVKDCLNQLNFTPSEFHTFDTSGGHTSSSSHFNFKLANGETLSIKSFQTSGSKKACPPIVGQCGEETFHRYFSHLSDDDLIKAISKKKLIIENIDEFFSIQLDFLFSADHLILFWLENDTLKWQHHSRSSINFNKWESDKFSFTRDLQEWNESTTIKYDGKSVAEAQIHSNRSGIKFRFDLKNLFDFLIVFKSTNESIGMAAEKAICEAWGIDHPSHLDDRSDPATLEQLVPICKKAFDPSNPPIIHLGSESGDRGGASKSSVDIKLSNGEGVSVKSNIGSMVCPPEVGQPGKDTFILHFQHLLSEDEINNFDHNTFKKLCFSKTSQMFEIYMKYLFDCDRLFWLKRHKDKWNWMMIITTSIQDMKWKQEDFTFSQTLDSWNESCSVRYQNIPIGSFQVHSHRNSFKFRFNMKNLCEKFLNLSWQ